MFMSYIYEFPILFDDWLVQPHALGPLRSGSPMVPQGLQQFTGPGGDFENRVDNQVRAFIVTPWKRNPNDGTTNIYEVQDSVDRIKGLLRDLGLGNNYVNVVPYTARDPDQDPLIFANGKVFIQYDPQERWLQGNGPCLIQEAKIQLWVDDYATPRYADQWLAFESQFPPPPLPPPPAPPVNVGPNHKARLLRGREVNSQHNEERESYEHLLWKRQTNGSCPLLNQNTSVFSTQSLLFTTTYFTAFQTSHVSSITTTNVLAMTNQTSLFSSEVALSRTNLHQSSTPEETGFSSLTWKPQLPFPTTSSEKPATIDLPTKSPTPAQPAPEFSNALTITRDTYPVSPQGVVFSFFQTRYGIAVDCSGQWQTRFAVNLPPGKTLQAEANIGGTQSFNLWGQAAQYKNNGEPDNLGELFVNGQAVSCFQDPGFTNPAYQCNGEYWRTPYITCPY